VSQAKTQSEETSEISEVSYLIWRLQGISDSADSPAAIAGAFVRQDYAELAAAMWGDKHGVVLLSFGFAVALRQHRDTCFQMLLFNFLFSSIFAENSLNLLWGEHIPLLCTAAMLPVQLEFRSRKWSSIKIAFDKQPGLTLGHWMFSIWHAVVLGAFLQT
jgi:hypothetical protein